MVEELEVMKRGFVFLGIAGAILAWSAFASAQQVGYEVRNRVQVGQKPAVILNVGENLDALSVVLKRSDGKVIKSNHKRIKAGKKVTVPFAQPRGKYSYDVTLKMVTPDGVQSAAAFEFDAVVAPPLELKLLREGTSLGDRKVSLSANTYVERAEVLVEGEAGVIESGEISLKDVKPGKGFPVTWSGSGEVKRIEIKVHDQAGFWQKIELIPFSVDIPHEEVEFDTGKASFAASEGKKLDDTLGQISKELEKHGANLEINLYIGGYTDTVGDKASNQALSTQRARAIGAYFRKRGLKIPILYQGFGEDGQAVKTEDNVDEPRNRRALYVLSNHSPPVSAHIPRLNWKRLK